MANDSIQKLAHMQFAITAVHMSNDELAAVADGKDPHDIMDYNLCIYGAWCATFFEEPYDAPDFHEKSNAANAACMDMIRGVLARNAARNDP